MSVDENRHEGLQARQLQTSSLVTLGELIAKKRWDIGLSLLELAEIIEVDPSIIEALESGGWRVDDKLRLEISGLLKLKLIDSLFDPTSV